MISAREGLIWSACCPKAIGLFHLEGSYSEPRSSRLNWAFGNLKLRSAVDVAAIHHFFSSRHITLPTIPKFLCPLHEIALADINAHEF